MGPHFLQLVTILAATISHFRVFHRVCKGFRVGQELNQAPLKCSPSHQDRLDLTADLQDHLAPVLLLLVLQIWDPLRHQTLDLLPHQILDPLHR